MISYLFRLLTGSFGLVNLYFYFFHEDVFNSFWAEAAYRAIYLFSYLQTKLRPFFEWIEKQQPTICFYREGNRVSHADEKYDLATYYPNNFGFEVATFDASADLTGPLEIQPSLVRFFTMVLEIHDGARSVPIRMVTDRYNFFVTGNKINLPFLQYYVKHVAGHMQMDFDRFKLEVLDDSFQKVTINETMHIAIGEKEYKVVSCQQ